MTLEVPEPAHGAIKPYNDDAMDGALDLSMKKPRRENASAPATTSSSSSSSSAGPAAASSHASTSLSPSSILSHHQNLLSMSAKDQQNALNDLQQKFAAKQLEMMGMAGLYPHGLTGNLADLPLGLAAAAMMPPMFDGMAGMFLQPTLMSTSSRGAWQGAWQRAGPGTWPCKDYS